MKLHNRLGKGAAVKGPSGGTMASHLWKAEWLAVSCGWYGLACWWVTRCAESYLVLWWFGRHCRLRSLLTVKRIVAEHVLLALK